MPTEGDMRPGPKGVAIIAAGATLELAPFDDPAWTKWTLNDFYDSVPRRIGRTTMSLGALFEMHPRSHYTAHREYQPNHEARMAELSEKGLITYLAFPNPAVPKAKIYPREEVEKFFGRSYFRSTVSYMIPIAIMMIVESLERADGAFAPRIGLWGCDMQLTSEYAKERSCVEYWLGRAEGYGIEIVIPDESPLLMSPYLYGYETEAIDKRLKLVAGRKGELQGLVDLWEKQLEVAKQTLAEYRGSLVETQWAEQNFTDARPDSQAASAP